MTTTMNTTDITLGYINARDARRAAVKEMESFKALTESRKTPTGRLSLKDKKTLAELSNKVDELHKVSTDAFERLENHASGILASDTVANGDRKEEAIHGIKQILAAHGLSLVDNQSVYDAAAVNYGASAEDMADSRRYAARFNIPELAHTVEERAYVDGKGYVPVDRPAAVHAILRFDGYANLTYVEFHRGAVRTAADRKSSNPLVDAYRIEIRSGMDGVEQSFSSHRDTPSSMRVYAKLLALTADVVERQNEFVPPVIRLRTKVEGMIAAAEKLIAEGELKVA